MKRWKRIAVLVAVVADFCIFLLFDPEQYALFPKCPSLLLTGYECPGCGSQRAIYHLLHLRIGTAFRYNALLVLLLPYLLICFYLEYLDGKQRFPRLYGTLTGKAAVIVLSVAIVVFTIVRNII